MQFVYINVGAVSLRRPDENKSPIALPFGRSLKAKSQPKGPGGRERRGETYKEERDTRPPSLAPPGGATAYKFIRPRVYIFRVWRAGAHTEVRGPK